MLSLIAMDKNKADNSYLEDIFMEDTMDNIEDFYILGVPIKTKIGILYPIYMSHYWILNKYVSVLVLEKEDVVDYLNKLSQVNEEFKMLFECAKEVGLHELIVNFKDDKFNQFFLHDIYIDYKYFFKFCFREDVFDKIQNDEELQYYIELIKDFNDIKYQKPNPNPEIAKFDLLERQLLEAKGELINFEAMYTSNLITSGIHPNEMTIYQFNKAFDRIGVFKSYDTSTLFKTVDVENKVDITPWYSEIKKKKPSTITDEELGRASTTGLRNEL